VVTGKVNLNYLVKTAFNDKNYLVKNTKYADKYLVIQTIHLYSSLKTGYSKRLIR
jgi:hypothetical protein